MKKIFFHCSTEKGLTLIEILASITILSVIIVSFLSMFVLSSRETNFSSDKINATYVAESTMEQMTHVVTISTGINSVLAPAGFTVQDCSTCYGSTIQGHFVYIKVYEKNPGNGLVTVIVKVYQDSSKEKQEVQMESLMAWKK
jgi:prepilin-type N-terminal cleavage/methylation domain-containing protein